MAEYAKNEEEDTRSSKLSTTAHYERHNSNEDSDDKVHLKRQIGLFTATCIVVGSIIGVGIFISPKGVLRQTQSVGMSLIIWCLCGLISIMGALCYAELGTMIPISGGEYIYIKTAFGDAPAFLVSWTLNLMIRPSLLAIICLASANYVLVPFFERVDLACGPPEIALKMVAISCVLLLAAVNAYSVKITLYLTNFFTVCKLLVIGIIIVVGIIRIEQGHTEHLRVKSSFDDTPHNIFSYGIAFYQGLYSFGGWHTLTYITEELVNPDRNLPIAILLGLSVVTIVYLLTNISYFTVLSVGEFLQSEAVAATFAGKTLGPMSWVIPLGVVLSIVGVLSYCLLLSARLPYVAAREGHMPDILSMVHVNRLTPLPSIIFLVTLIIIMILPGTIDTLVNYFSFVSWLVYGSVFLALLWLRYKHPEWKRPIKVPIVIPAIVLIASLYLIAAPIIDNPSVEFLYAGLFVLAGLVVYYPIVYRKYHPSFLGRVTYYLQVLLFVAPSGYNKIKKTTKKGEEERQEPGVGRGKDEGKMSRNRKSLREKGTLKERNSNKNMRMYKKKNTKKMKTKKNKTTNIKKGEEVDDQGDRK
ncbi:b(0,+)-type amino acid transporter 1-like [Amphiura filiformis]|uniref:b(0,+)-type amino acid transporter 1-like n=1 Tax=Amphiura filiformis TaxID=82378 RepID=UPI003B20CD62